MIIRKKLLITLARSENTISSSSWDDSEFSAANFPNVAAFDVAKMVETIDLGPANPRISPLIKLSRWSLLIGGIFWGMHRYTWNFKTWIRFKWHAVWAWELARGMNALQLTMVSYNCLISWLGSNAKKWTALMLSPEYLFRYNKNKAAEDEIRAYNARMKPIWDAQAAAEKAKANKEEMEKLAKEFR